MDQKKEYTIGPVIWDNEEELFFCKMGIPTKTDLTLHYTVWGRTKLTCTLRAQTLAELLTPKTIQA